MYLQITVSILVITFNVGMCWPVFPEIPSGHRSQFLISNADGSYDFGYDTGEGLAAKQVSDSANQVYGLYLYKDELGQDVEVKYTAGIQGFVPTGLDTTSSISKNTKTSSSIGTSSVLQSVPHNTEDVFSSSSDQVAISKLKQKESQQIYPNYENSFIKEDGSYSFAYSTDHVHREESGDGARNVKGKYSYKDDAGDHDLSYEAGDATGFLVTGGNLAKPNGLRELQTPGPESAVFYSLPFESPSNDSSYSFEYSTPLHSRQEIGDAKGTVYGRYSFVNEAGTHDLIYVAGSETGFLPIGGSLLEVQPAAATSRASEDEQTYAKKTLEVNAKKATNKNTVDIGDPSHSYVISFNDDTKHYEDLKDKPVSTYAQDYKTQNLGVGRRVQNSSATKSLSGGHDFSYVAGVATGSPPTVTGSSLSLHNAQGPNIDGTLIPSFKGSLNVDVSSKNSAIFGKDQIVLRPVLVYGYLPVSGKQRYGYIYDAL